MFGDDHCPCFRQTFVLNGLGGGLRVDSVSLRWWRWAPRSAPGRQARQQPPVRLCALEAADVLMVLSWAQNIALSERIVAVTAGAKSHEA